MIFIFIGGHPGGQTGLRHGGVVNGAGKSNPCTSEQPAFAFRLDL
ncbi:hypothetical protein [Sinorhizobium saheli]|nr:hypothetical protein [Sinorhizobium saheli]